MSFAVQGESSTRGTSFIKVSNVLEGPYIVTADGVSTDFDILEDSTGQSTMVGSYSYDAHDVVVVGTVVIPEFPVTMVGVIAAIIGLVVVVTRTKIYQR